jgi:hypothetical protein
LSSTLRSAASVRRGWQSHRYTGASGSCSTSTERAPLSHRRRSLPTSDIQIQRCHPLQGPLTAKASDAELLKLYCALHFLTCPGVINQSQQLSYKHPLSGSPSASDLFHLSGFNGCNGPWLDSLPVLKVVQPGTVGLKSLRYTTICQNYPKVTWTCLFSGTLSAGHVFDTSSACYVYAGFLAQETIRSGITFLGG